VENVVEDLAEVVDGRPGTPGPVAGPAGDTAEPPGAEDALPEIRFVRPLPGFPGLSRFVLVTLGDERSADPEPADGADRSPAPGAGDGDATGPVPVLYELRSIEQPEIRFLVVVPSAFFSDYAFELDDATCAALGLSDAADALVLVIVTVGGGEGRTTANLMAPVVVNGRTRTAAQVILSGSDWPIRAAVA